MASLFLSTLLNSLLVQGGFQFRDCLNDNKYSSTDIYGSVNTFTGKLPDKEIFCCDLSPRCSLMTPGCPYSAPNAYFQCHKILQSTFCSSYAVSFLPGGVCGGI